MVSGATGSPAPPRQVVQALARRLAPGGSRRLDPAAPEVGDGLGHLALGRPRLGQPDQDPARLRMGRRARQEPPGLALGVGPQAQPERGVVGGELRLRQQEGVGEAAR